MLAKALLLGWVS